MVRRPKTRRITPFAWAKARILGANIGRGEDIERAHKVAAGITSCSSFELGEKIIGQKRAIDRSGREFDVQTDLTIGGFNIMHEEGKPVALVHFDVLGKPVIQVTRRFKEELGAALSVALKNAFAFAFRPRVRVVPKVPLAGEFYKGKIK